MRLACAVGSRIQQPQDLRTAARSPRPWRRLTLTALPQASSPSPPARGIPNPGDLPIAANPGISTNTNSQDRTDSFLQRVADEEEVAARASPGRLLPRYGARLRQPVPSVQVSAVFSRMSPPVAIGVLKCQGLP